MKRQIPLTRMTLRPQEVRAFTLSPGSGGQQSLAQHLYELIHLSLDESGSSSIELTDEELGKIVRYMGAYGGGDGGFQGRLRKTFSRSLFDLIR